MRNHTRPLSAGSPLVSLSVASFVVIRLLLKAGPRLLPGKFSHTSILARPVLTEQCKSSSGPGFQFLPFAYAKVMHESPTPSKVISAFDEVIVNPRLKRNQESQISGRQSLAFLSSLAYYMSQVLIGTEMLVLRSPLILEIAESSCTARCRSFSVVKTLSSRV